MKPAMVEQLEQLLAQEVHCDGCITAWAIRKAAAILIVDQAAETHCGQCVGMGRVRKRTDSRAVDHHDDGFVELLRRLEAPEGSDAMCEARFFVLLRAAKVASRSERLTCAERIGEHEEEHQQRCAY